MKYRYIVCYNHYTDINNKIIEQCDLYHYHKSAAPYIPYSVASSHDYCECNGYKTLREALTKDYNPNFITLHLKNKKLLRKAKLIKKELV